ncbi:hypothetical protein [Nocardia sp. NPDC004604]|uniref:hypothetical protein n=1 Tax=Nocardia sp. NPDC004604 TaxID=3157013 RepID=UPI0033BF48CD
MSTSIVKGAAKGIDADAETWLATTDLAGAPKAAIQLSRAIAPARYGFGVRRPLDLASSDDRTHIVLDLLRAKQVPTADAVDALARRSHSSRGVGTPTACDEQITHAERILQAEGDSLGSELSSAVTLHRIDHNHGPTWQQAWAFDAVSKWWLPRVGGMPPFKPIGRIAFATLHKAGWLASNQTVRSLCPGRRFYVRFYGDHVSHMSPEVVGFAVATFISNGGHANCIEILHDWCGDSLKFLRVCGGLSIHAVSPSGVISFFTGVCGMEHEINEVVNLSAVQDYVCG